MKFIDENNLDTELFRNLMNEYPKQTNHLMEQYYCELSPDYMCFDDYYRELSKIVPKDMIIIDVGCYMAAQAYFFKDYAKYIGVDICQSKLPEDKQLEHFYFVERFQFDNTTHYECEAQNWIKTILPTLNLDLDHVFAICSAVPDEKVQDLVNETFPNYFIWYPGKQIKMNCTNTCGVNKNDLINIDQTKQKELIAEQTITKQSDAIEPEIE